MAEDYRLDPFQDVLNTVNISGETHLIPSVSPFTIQLKEVPLKETPSSISLSIGGYTATEVSSQPATGEFWPDYSTGADGDDDWNTGTILFNASAAGKTVVVSYKGTGSVVWAEVVNTHIITATRTVTVPHWATKALISGCGAGGGGGRSTSMTANVYGGGGGAGGYVINWPVTVVGGAVHNVIIGTGGASGAYNGYAATGGITSFGSLLSLGGGTGGGGSGINSPNGSNGSSPISIGYEEPAATGAGRGGLFGTGGQPVTAGTNGSNPGSGWGSGASGGRNADGGKGADGLLIIRWVA